VTETQLKAQCIDENNIWSIYLYALKSPVTRQKYQKRLEKFFDYLEIDGKTIEEKSIAFVNYTKEYDARWTFNVILKFMQSLLERFNRKEITGSTTRNYLKSIKIILLKKTA